MAVDLRALVEGMTIRWGDLDLVVDTIIYRRKGWVRVLLTLDGEGARLDTTCACDEDHGQTPVIDLVTEAEYLCCSRCRKVMDL